MRRREAGCGKKMPPFLDFFVNPQERTFEFPFLIWYNVQKVGAARRPDSCERGGYKFHCARQHGPFARRAVGAIAQGRLSAQARSLAVRPCGRSTAGAAAEESPRQPSAGCPLGGWRATRPRPVGRPHCAASGGQNRRFWQRDSSTQAAGAIDQGRLPAQARSPAVAPPRHYI